MTVNTLEAIYYMINIGTILFMFVFKLGYVIGKSERK